MNKKGFSIIEIIIVIAIAGILSSIVTNSFRTAQLKKEQSGIVQGITSYLEKQKADTQAGKGGSNYGIKFNSDSYILYKGITFNQNDTTNQTFTLQNGFTLNETVTNSSNTIYFSRLTGESNENATITVSHFTNKVTPQFIIINKSGTISVIE